MDNIDFCLWEEVILHSDIISVFSLSCTAKSLCIFRPKNVDLFIQAVSHGYLEILKWLHTDKLDPHIANVAALAGHLDILEWYFSITNALPEKVSFYAAQGGHISIYKWLPLVNRLDRDYLTAASYGELELLKYMLEEKPYFSSDLCNNAASNGKVETLEWLLNNGHEYIPQRELEIYRDHIRILELLESKGYALHPKVCETGALFGLEVVKWGFSRGCTLTMQTMVNAALVGDISTIKFCIENGLNLDFRLTLHAAKAGKFECLCWLVENGCRLENKITMYAAMSGNIEILEWLLSKGVTIHDATAVSAAARENLNVLQWLEEKDYTIDNVNVFDTALTHGNINILNYLYDKGYRHEQDIFKSLIEMDIPESLEWLLDHGYTNDYNILEIAIDNCSREVISWLVETNRPVDAELLLTNGYFKQIKLLYDKGHKLPDNVCDYFIGNDKYMSWAIVTGLKK